MTEWKRITGNLWLRTTSSGNVQLSEDPEKLLWLTLYHADLQDVIVILQQINLQNPLG